jgi:hypothetical protein
MYLSSLSPLIRIFHEHHAVSTRNQILKHRRLWSTGIYSAAFLIQILNNLASIQKNPFGTAHAQSKPKTPKSNTIVEDTFLLIHLPILKLPHQSSIVRIPQRMTHRETLRQHVGMSAFENVVSWRTGGISIFRFLDSGNEIE